LPFWHHFVVAALLSAVAVDLHILSFVIDFEVVLHLDIASRPSPRRLVDSAHLCYSVDAVEAAFCLLSLVQYTITRWNTAGAELETQWPISAVL
jgi:hypothetical protein